MVKTADSRYSLLFVYKDELDLNCIESFEMFIPEDTAANINFVNENIKYNIIFGLLDNNQENFRSSFQIIMNYFEIYFDNKYSIAVNTGYLKTEDLDNYSYAGLLNIETEALLKSAKIFNAWMQPCHFTDQNKLYALQTLVDKIYQRILQISFFLSQLFQAK